MEDLVMREVNQVREIIVARRGSDSFPDDRDALQDDVKSMISFTNIKKLIFGETHLI